MVNERIGQCELKLSKAGEQLEQTTRVEVVRCQRELEKLQDTERKLQEDLQESTVDLEKVSSKLGLLLKKKDECLKATRNLGVLPTDAYDKYQGRCYDQRDTRTCVIAFRSTKHISKS